jgi:hypothetical protein
LFVTRRTSLFSLLDHVISNWRLPESISNGSRRRTSWWSCSRYSSSTHIVLLVSKQLISSLIPVLRFVFGLLLVNSFGSSRNDYLIDQCIKIAEIKMCFWILKW